MFGLRSFADAKALGMPLAAAFSITTTRRMQNHPHAALHGVHVADVMRIKQLVQR
jgi:hypothetical protein